MSPPQALFDALRSACSPASWSRGVQLARDGAVFVESEYDDEICLRVTVPGQVLAATVTLFPDDVDWDCECPAKARACEHAAAAVIALQRAEQGESELPEANTARGRIGYRFTRDKNSLRFERVVVRSEEETRLDVGLSSLKKESSGPSILVEPADLEIEHRLGSRREGVIDRQTMPRLLAALAGAADVRLDGKPVTTAAEAVGLVAKLVDQDEGFRLFLAPDPEIDVVFGQQAALCGRTLKPIREVELTARERQELAAGKSIPGDQAGQLVAEILPGLEKRLPVIVETRRLPRRSAARARIVVDVRTLRSGASVTPQIVYGDPVIARVQHGHLLAERGATVPRRDRAAESRLAQLVRQKLELIVGQPTHLSVDQALDLADRVTLLIEQQEGARTPSISVEGDGLESFRRLPALAPRFEMDGSVPRFWLESQMAAADSGDSRHFGEVSIEDAIAAWKDGSGSVLVGDRGYAALPADWLSRFGDSVADLLQARQADGALPLASMPDLARLTELLDHPPPPQFEKLRALVEEFTEIPSATLPSGLQADLRDYQRIGVDWLAFHRDLSLGALLADDMGLGKTLQAIACLPSPSLVVAPTSVLHNWKAEIERFYPGLSVNTYHGRDRKLDDSDVTLTTYSILRLDVETLEKRTWASVTLDEAQAIKNPKSQAARAACRLSADWRVALTGTPVENRLDELWSVMQFLNPGLLGGRTSFDERYTKPIAEGDEIALEQLRLRLRPFVLRRLKSEVAPELPPRTDVVLRCALSEKERAVYDAIRVATRDDVARALAGGGSPLKALEALLRLRQASCHSALVPGQQAETSSKVKLLVDTLEQIAAEDHRALVFSQWTSLLDLIEPHLKSASLPFLRLDGSTRDRAGLVNTFQSDDGPPVLLISLKAGGTGLNLTRADNVILVDPWWNPAVEDQAADRAHRIGQENPVLVQRLVAADTVEERILELQQRKRAVADAALSDATAAQGGLSRDDLLALLD